MTVFIFMDFAFILFFLIFLVAVLVQHRTDNIAWVLLLLVAFLLRSLLLLFNRVLVY